MSKTKTVLSDKFYEIRDMLHGGLISDEEAERMINKLPEDVIWVTQKQKDLDKAMSDIERFGKGMVDIDE